MQVTALYSLEELLQERREGAVRALVRAVGYALSRGLKAEAVGRFLFQSYNDSGLFKRCLLARGRGNGTAFAAQHAVHRWGLCDEVETAADDIGIVIKSASMLQRHEEVLDFHGVTRLDMESCVETYWRLTGRELGLDVSYTVGDQQDWLLIRPADGGSLLAEKVDGPAFSTEGLATHRRIALASSIIASIGFAKHLGEEPEDLGLFFYKVWEGSGHYDKLRERWGYGNALAYAQSLAQSRQVLYAATTLVEDLDGFTVASPGWSIELPHVMGLFGVLADDVCRYFAGGGVPACMRLGLQYGDQSDDRIHRVWIRSR